MKLLLFGGMGAAMKLDWSGSRRTGEWSFQSVIEKKNRCCSRAG